MSTSNSALTSSKIKQVCKSMSTLIFMIGLMYTAGQATAQVTGTGVKWHPGHYYELVGQGSKGDSRYLNNVYQELQQTPTLNGIVVRYRWGELETSQNVYNFSAIESRLAELTVLKKRLIVLIETKSNTPDVESTLVPNYAKTVLYEGGIYPYDSSTVGGYGTKLWNANVRWRLTRLVRELGKRFNTELYFEGVGFSESATGKPAIPLTSTQVDAFYANLQTLNKELKTSFPNTLTFQYLNYPRNILASFIEIFKQKGIALGNPDVFLDDPGLSFPGTKYSPPGVYTYYPKLSGTIPLVVQVENANYLNTRHDNTGYQPTVEELLTYARDNLQVNYLFWTRTPTFFPKVLELLNFSAQKTATAGGLKFDCPTAYSSCIQD
ncbi:MAG TPA: hypothetical protein V6D19_02295 [Stenomitos sp.]